MFLGCSFTPFYSQVFYIAGYSPFYSNTFARYACVGLLHVFVDWRGLLIQSALCINLLSTLLSGLLCYQQGRYIIIIEYLWIFCFTYIVYCDYQFVIYDDCNNSFTAGKQRLSVLRQFMRATSGCNLQFLSFSHYAQTCLSAICIFYLRFSGFWLNIKTNIIELLQVIQYCYSSPDHLPGIQHLLLLPVSLSISWN